MGEEIESNVCRGEWTMGWSSDSPDKHIPSEAAPVCDDSPIQFHEFGLPTSIWGQDLLSSMRSDLGCDNRLKQEEACLDLDSSRKVSDMFVGEEAWHGIIRSTGLSLSSQKPTVAAKDSFMDTKKCGDESLPKRPRSNTHPPFTTFKVRKEKLGDRISALQQLISPFGKTDTASVLLDAIDYIKFLHDQVTVLCTPYMMLSHELSGTSMDGDKEGKKGLRSKGLCLVPISTTLHVAKDDTSDFWAPTFGGSYR